jgi:hypothetical protein
LADAGTEALRPHPVRPGGFWTGRLVECVGEHGQGARLAEPVAGPALNCRSGRGMFGGECRMAGVEPHGCEDGQCTTFVDPEAGRPGDAQRLFGTVQRRIVLCQVPAGVGLSDERLDLAELVADRSGSLGRLPVQRDGGGKLAHAVPGRSEGVQRDGLDPRFLHGPSHVQRGLREPERFVVAAKVEVRGDKRAQRMDLGSWVTEILVERHSLEKVLQGTVGVTEELFGLAEDGRGKGGPTGGLKLAEVVERAGAALPRDAEPAGQPLGDAKVQRGVGFAR